MAVDYQWAKKYSLGEMENASFDETYRLMKRSIYGFDSDASVYRPLKVNADGELVIDNTNIELWTRSDSTLTPKTANDSIDLGSGNFDTTGTISDGALTISDGSITDGVNATFSGTGTFGSTYQAIIGDDANTRSGYFTDGTDTLAILNGSSGLSIDISGSGDPAIVTSSSTETVTILDTSCMMTVVTSNAAMCGIEITTAGSTAGSFNDGTYDIDICNGSYAITVNAGDISAGSANYTGTGNITLTGGDFILGGAINKVDASAVTGDAVTPMFLFSSKTLGATEVGEAVPSGLNKIGSQEFFNMAGASSTTIFGGGVTDDTYRRFRLVATGQMCWGSGAAATDVSLTRSSANTLRIDNNFNVGGTTNTTGKATFDGGVRLTGTDHLEFTGADEYIYSPSAGKLANVMRGAFHLQVDSNNNDAASAILFQVNEGSATIGAGNNLISAQKNGEILISNKLKFTQTDGNEYIDSLNTGYMDYGATTAHRFDTPIRGMTSLWWRVQHVDLASTPALGATGATYTPQSANNLNGYQLDNAPSEEYIYFNTHVGTDWDEASDMEVVVQFETNVDNSGGGVGDTVDFDLVMYYKGNGETAQKTQDLDASVIVGQAGQYYHEQVMFTIDWDKTDHVVQVGDCISFALHLNDDDPDNQVVDVIAHHAMFRYKTNKVRAEV